MEHDLGIDELRRLERLCLEQAQDDRRLIGRLNKKTPEGDLPAGGFFL